MSIDVSTYIAYGFKIPGALYKQWQDNGQYEEEVAEIVAPFDPIRTGSMWTGDYGGYVISAVMQSIDKYDSTVYELPLVDAVTRSHLTDALTKLALEVLKLEPQDFSIGWYVFQFIS